MKRGNYAAAMILGGIASRVFSNAISDDGAVLLVLFAWIAVAIAMTVSRLNDAGRNPWISVLTPIPFVWIWVAFMPTANTEPRSDSVECEKASPSTTCHSSHLT